MKADSMSSTSELLTARANTIGMLPALLLAATLSGCSLFTSTTSTGGASIHVAEAALSGGSPRVALQVAQNILNRSPDDVPALLIRGDALTQLSHNDDAAAAFQRALSKDPNSAHGKIGLARIRLTTNPTEAASLFRDALRTEPNNANALTNLGIALDLLGQHREAQDFYQRVLHDNPTSVPAKVNLALSLAMSGDSATALRLIEPIARDRSATIKIRHNYAAILAMAGRSHEASAVVKSDVSPEDTTRAVAAYKQGTAIAVSGPIQPESAPAHAAEGPVAPPPVVVAKAEPAPEPTPAPVVVAQAPKLPPVAPTEMIVVTQTSAPLTSVPLAAALVPVAPAFDPPAPMPPAAVDAAVPPPAAQTTSLPTETIGPHVQLGAFNSETAARDEWVCLQQKVPDLLAGRDGAITTVERNGTTFWRLRTWGFPDQDAARAFCSQIKAATPRCMVFGGLSLTPTRPGSPVAFPPHRAPAESPPHVSARTGPRPTTQATVCAGRVLVQLFR
jgi:Flp pilus assembly protein TadD